METTTETEERFMIREKDSSKPPRGSDACYDIQVLIGNVRAAFTYNIPEDPKQALIANTWNGNTAYFLGLVTPPIEGCLYIANCACVMRRFTTKKFWKKDWLVQEREWFICATTKCSSMCCQACFEENKVKKIGDAYKCPFPCKTGMTYNKCNDPKKISKMLKRVEKDEKKCANCGMTRKMFWKRKPFCKLLSFATFPDGSGKLVKKRGLGRPSVTNQLRSLEYKLEFNQITQEEYDNKIEEIEAKKMKLEKEKEEKTSTKKKSKKTRTKTNKGDTNKETEQSGTTSLGELMRECDIVSESSTDSDN